MCRFPDRHRTGPLKGGETAKRMSAAKTVDRQAAEWFVELLCADSVSGVLPELNAWLRADPAHRAAFLEIQRSWRLAATFWRASRPDASAAQVDAFFEALEEERCRGTRTKL